MAHTNLHGGYSTTVFTRHRWLPRQWLDGFDFIIARTVTTLLFFYWPSMRYNKLAIYSPIYCSFSCCTHLLIYNAVVAHVHIAFIERVGQAVTIFRVEGVEQFYSVNCTFLFFIAKKNEHAYSQRYPTVILKTTLS